MTEARPYRSKTTAAWLALGTGTVGGHRFYLHGWRDVWAWLHPLPALAGLAGVLRMRDRGPDDQLAWLLIPLLGLAISAAMLAVIVLALTPDTRWDARHNPALPPGQPGKPGGWGAVLAAALALLLGGGVLMATVAFGGQRLFEWLQEPTPVAAQGSRQAVDLLVLHRS